jgi:hypothetical protein
LRFLVAQISVFDFVLCVDGNYHNHRKENDNGC